MILDIGIIGCGSWSEKVIKEINNNKYFNLKSIVCRQPSQKKFIKNVKIYKDIESLFNENINDCIFVAANPELNLEIVELAKKNKIPLILEKPVSNSFKNAEKLKEIANNNEIIVLPNIINYFSETFDKLKEFVEFNISNIEKIIVYEGNFGPFRKNINPIWDWGFHPITMLVQLFGYKNFSNLKMYEIKNNKSYNLGIVTRFNFLINSKIKVKIITGNYFKKKIRKIKIILKNNNCLICDMTSHKIFYEDKIIFENKITPLNSLLDNFYKCINEKNIIISKKLIETSCKTTKILETFYKC